MHLPNKALVHEALRDALRAALDTMVAAAKDAASGATHEENRQEGDKDMRATEQSYLARGQAMRAEALADDLARFEVLRVTDFGADDAIAAGALVHVELDDDDKVLFIAAQGGGTVLEVDGVRVTVVTPSSPMGRAICGRREGDDLELVVAGKKREGAILAVC